MSGIARQAIPLGLQLRCAFKHMEGSDGHDEENNLHMPRMPGKACEFF
jgi:hypothetical protein